MVLCQPSVHSSNVGDNNKIVCTVDNADTLDEVLDRIPKVLESIHGQPGLFLDGFLVEDKRFPQYEAGSVFCLNRLVQQLR